MIRLVPLLAALASLQFAYAGSIPKNLKPLSVDLPFNPSMTEGGVSGLTNPVAPSPFVIGGSEVTPHSHPHQVGLIITIDENQGGFCGGVLITNLWILTAAHCADHTYEITAVIGAHNISQDEPTALRIRVGEKVVHPGWNKFWLRNDIALLKLENPIEVDLVRVKPIRLPSRSTKGDTFLKAEATASGWGSVSDKKKQISPILRSVTSTVVSNLYCKINYLFLFIRDSNICISGSGSRGVCVGDSGGPLTIEESDGQRTLIGIASFTINFACEWSWPSAFTRVTSYLDWIATVSGLELRP